MKLAPALAGLLLMAGLTSCSTQADLRTSCDQLHQAITADLDTGTAAPDADALARLLPKVKAIVDAGDGETKGAFAPLLASLEKVGAGDTSGGFGFLTSLSGLMGTCASAGSAAWVAVAASATPSASPSPSVTVDPAECRLIADGVADAILADSGRTAVGSGAVTSGTGSYLVALKLRSGEVGVWLLDSITDPASVLSVDSTASSVSGWGPAGSGDFTPEALAKAKACVA
jgi:hypothetical protein